MKLKSILLLGLCLQVSATAVAQGITIIGKNITLDKVFNSIRQQTGYNFAYSNELLKLAHPVTLHIKDGSLQQVLDSSFTSQPLTYQINNNVIIVKQMSAQTGNQATPPQLTRFGKIKDAVKGQALPGVTIQVKGSKHGTVTDAEGNFQLTAPDGATLVISYLGYEKTEIPVQGRTTLDIALRPLNSGLNEVVVVGYGTQKKLALTGSVASISTKDLTTAPAMNISNVLAGKLPGLIAVQQSGRPGYDNATLRIRGLSTYGDNSPAVIVDGVQRTFEQLDPNEIASISILKDAAAAATYGVQGANGVILVTTRKGSARKATVSYNGELSINSFTRFPKFLNGPDYMEWYHKAEEVDNDYLKAIGANQVPYTYKEEDIAALRNGTNTNPFYANTDWIGQFLDRKSASQHHNLSVSGGTEKVKYFSSLGYLKQDGVIRNTSFERFNFRTNLDYTFSKLFDANINLGIRKENRRNPGLPADNAGWMNPFFQAIRALPNMPAYTDKGVPVASLSEAGIVNPIASVDGPSYQRAETFSMQGNLQLNLHVPFVPGLDVTTLLAYDRSNQQSWNWQQAYDLMVRMMGGSWYWLPARSPGLLNSGLFQSYDQGTRSTFQPAIRYSRDFDAHNISGLLLYEYAQYDGNGFWAGAKNFPLPDIKELTFGGKGSADFIYPSGSSNTTKRAGYVGRLNYGYRNKYFAEVVSRYDGSMNFPAGKRWGFFPAASAGWVVSEEPFFQRLTPLISLLKIKASAGKLGNDRTGAFQYLQTFSLSNAPTGVFGNQAVSTLYTGAPANPNITWEKATTYNVGFETAIKGELLGIQAEYFYKITTDILMGQSGLFPPSMGGNYLSTVNAGRVQNRGVDLQITHANKIGKKFHYNVQGNFTWARNKILRIDDPAGIPSWQHRVGHQIDAKIGYVAEGLFKDWDEVKKWPSSPVGATVPGFIKYKDLNGDGKITPEDMTFTGKANLPEIIYGINIGASYGPLDLSLVFQGAGRCDVALAGTYEGSAGNSYVQDNTPFSRTFYGNGNSPYYLVENAWRPDHTDARYPRLTADKAGYPQHNGLASSFWIVDGSYLRLKSAQLGISLGPKALARLKIQQCRLYVAGFNLFTMDHLKYLDPEMPNVNNGFYPQQRMTTLGTNITF
ncbi:TonB-dependent receptor [Chitinophaga qingshengii]|uniref:TonB-dependent receptor n=1 Tax=Chitinophaga qingshengii TaxID=1569794 RepID=A0ABR7TFT8_9BACT|nr:TonB-dependent receptor [Chitinophaga qingshengii]MBC9929251.1 TonB-dependent receptor [Chitinophaga qingshengii]